jgi:hypothetical protein
MSRHVELVYRKGTLVVRRSGKDTSFQLPVTLRVYEDEELLRIEVQEQQGEREHGTFYLYPEKWCSLFH